MNDKLTQRPEPSKSIEAMKAACLLVQGEDWPVANVTLDRAVVSGAVNEYRALQAYIDTLEAQLEAVKRLAKALTHDPEGCYSSCEECLEASAAYTACLAVGIDPKEL